MACNTCTTTCTCNTCNPCHVTPTQAPCPVCAPSCNPCENIASATPMTNCAPVVSCNEGCETTLTCECVIYTGDHLGTIGLFSGETVCAALVKINTLLAQLIMVQNASMPTYSYTVRCLNSSTNPVSLVVFSKNGVSQIGAAVQYPNPAALLAFLVTIDPAWVFTGPNVFTIHSPHTWVLGITCPQV